MKDWRGNEYDVGSTVVYPRQSGRSVTMVEGVVRKIEPATEPDYTKDYDSSGRWPRKPVPGRYVVHIERTRGARWWVGGIKENDPYVGPHYKPQLSKIQNTENITVVT